MERLVEICCGSYEDALNAYYGRAKRIELNSALHLGGLTPSIASLKLTKKNTNLKIITMIRPRGAGFCYNDIEFEVMKEDARCMLENKADGIAFGCLNQDGSINEKQTKEMIDIIKEYQGEVVFHRAFDCVADPYASIELLIHLGVDRILTSGLKPKAMDGKELIKDLQNNIESLTQPKDYQPIEGNSILKQEIFKQYRYLDSELTKVLVHYRAFILLMNTKTDGENHKYIVNAYYIDGEESFSIKLFEYLVIFILRLCKLDHSLSYNEQTIRSLILMREDLEKLIEEQVDEISRGSRNMF